MLALFEKSGNEKLMKQVLTSLFDAVSESREIRHYFLNVRLERLIKDQMLYSPYILHRDCCLETVGFGGRGIGELLA